MIHRYLRMLLVLMLGTILTTMTACGAATPSLTGTYAMMQNGTLQPIIRVSAEGNAWMLEVKSSGGWSVPTPATRMTDADYARLFGADSHTMVVQGVASPGSAVIQIKPGSVIVGKTYASDYLLVTMLGAAPLEKLP